MKEETFRLPAGVFTLRADGILVGTPTEKDMELEDAKQFVELWKRLFPNGNMRVLLDQRGVKRKMSPAARQHLAEATRPMVEKMAILVSNMFSRFFASGVLAATGMSNKARAFDDEAAALDWLKQANGNKAANG